ncbi:MAG: helix-turn-helix domain-containing protein [Chloroflexota bacterium]
MIYTKPISDISWNDVEAFCQQEIGEGAYLDYKEDFPTQLEKTISAMANTFGGMVLIGIEENEDRKPILPIKGILFQRGLSEKVTSIILSNITPPVFPEIQICKNEVGDKAVIVIRIPQSHETPHAISSNTRVYLRTGDINKPEELATISQIDWLTSNRQKSVSLRETLYQQAEKRYQAFYTRVMNELTSRGNSVQATNTGLLTLSACPTYPHKEYRTPASLSKIFEKISVRDYFGTSRVFPPADSINGTIVQNGIVFLSHVDSGRRVFYTEIDSQGLYFYRQPVRRELINQGGVQREILNGGEIVARIDEFLNATRKFYFEIGYWGYLDIKIALTEIQEYGLSLGWLNSTFFDSPIGFCPDNEVVYRNTILVSNSDTEKERLLFEGAQKLFWAFGLNLLQDYLEVFYKKLKS